MQSPLTFDRYKLVSTSMRMEVVNYHPVSILFLIAQAFDVLTTLFGLYALPQLWEANPAAIWLGSWPLVVLWKWALALTAVMIIEWMRRPLCLGKYQLLSGNLPRAIWIIPVIAGLPAIWNLLVILLEILA